MTATVTTLSSRYASINNDIHKLTEAHAGDGDLAAMSRLVLRAAILNARLHNDDTTMAGTLRTTADEIDA